MLVLLVALGAMLSASQSCPDIKPWHGRFITFGDTSGCTYLMNGQRLGSEVSIDEIRAYGLLQVSCPDCSLNIISPFETCDDCIICAHNEGLEGCRSTAVPIIISAIISVASTTILIVLLLWVDSRYKIIHRMIDSLHVRRVVKKESKKKRMINLITEEFELVKKGAEREHKSIYPSLPTTGEGTVRPRSPSPTRSLLSLAIASSLGMARACDDLMFLHANGDIFRDSSHTQVSNGMTILHSGSTLCMNYANGSSESLRLVDIKQVEKFVPMYEACSFSLEVKSAYACKGASLCWNEVNCNSKSRYSIVGPKAYTVPSDQVGCVIVPNLSETTCMYEQICIWYYWDQIIDSKKCDVVFKLESRSLLAHFEYTDFKGNIIPFILSDSDPLTSSPIITHLISIQAATNPERKHLRKHGGLYMYSDAADMNVGQPGILGDFQKSILTNSTYYPLWAVKCSPDGSRMSCVAPEPGYDRTLAIDSKNIVDVKAVGKRSVSVLNDVRGTISLMIRTDPDPTQTIIAASCSVEVSAVYGCTSCAEKPFIVVRAKDIITTGILRFKSNCSFYLHEISCGSQPQRIELMESPESCEVTFSGTNQTLHFGIPYEFRGEIYKMGVVSYRSENSFQEKLMLGLQSPDFLSSLKISLGVGVFTTVVVTILKSTSRYAAYRVGKTEAEV